MRGRTRKDTTNSTADPLTGRTIALGITGGIAAYKSADLTSRLVKRGATVHVIMTESATKLVAPATFRALSGNPVITQMFVDAPQPIYPHIDIGQSADILVVAPATANIIAKFAHGIADDALSTLHITTRAPILIAPAMNTAMWDHATTQDNLRILTDRGYTIMQPGEGRLACGDVGAGRMAEPEEIVRAIEQILAAGRDMDGLRVVITAGPTREAIDPIRYISNRSSGKQGYAIALEAVRRGAQVTLITGPTSLDPPAGAHVVNVTSVSEMADASAQAFDECDVFVACAAGADYVPDDPKSTKIKKGKGNLDLHLLPARDILSELAARKREQFVVGFAAETENLLQGAQEKLARKKLDLIAANDVSVEGIGFESDRNAITLIGPAGVVGEFGPEDKSAVAAHLLDAILRLRQQHK
jgi:phosphopantothenoylcysteine decarboxylase/phosphopantothenate--cysteine ligase